MYDVVIVGGGIAGSGVARDAALRGLDVLLLEQQDFGWGTTANSTRLAHGGLRYLEQYEFGLVFESLQERETLGELAPHLVTPLEFVIPQYETSLPERLKLRAGMILYDVLAYGKTVPGHRSLSPGEVQDLEPSLPADDLDGGFLYHDRQIEFVERLCLETVLDAERAGADVVNHAAVTAINRDGESVTGVTVQDRLTNETLQVDGRTVLNAAGPWADSVLEELDLGSVLRPAKGIHLVVPRLTERALTLPTTDGRVFFVVPWGDKSLIGTTDTAYLDDPGEARATAEDVELLLNELNRFYPSIGPDDILYTWAGVRPLYDEGKSGDTASVSRDHKVIDHGHPVEGLFSLIGAKITPYRAAAEDATDAIMAYLNEDAPCRTAQRPLPGGQSEPALEAELPGETLDHLRALYGGRADDVLEYVGADSTLGEPLCEHSDDILAQVTFAVEEEHARRLPDVMFRRCWVGNETCEGRDAVNMVLDHMADLLEWDDARRESERAAYEEVLERRHAFRADVAAIEEPKSESD